MGLWHKRHSYKLARGQLAGRFEIITSPRCRGGQEENNKMTTEQNCRALRYCYYYCGSLYHPARFYVHIEITANSRLVFHEKFRKGVIDCGNFFLHWGKRVKFKWHPRWPPSPNICYNFSSFAPMMINLLFFS